MQRIKWLPLAILMLTASCSHGQGNSPCDLFHPIYLEKGDNMTLNTEREILSHNETGRIACGWPYVR